MLLPLQMLGVCQKPIPYWIMSSFYTIRLERCCKLDKSIQFLLGVMQCLLHTSLQTPLNAGPATLCCTISYTSSYVPLPACLLHTRYIACKRIHAELKLRARLLAEVLCLHDNPPAMQRHSGNSSHFSPPSYPPADIGTTHPSHPEIPENSPSLATHNTSIPDLCRAGIAVHLAELELGLRARSLRERGVADDVAEGLSVRAVPVSTVSYAVRMRDRKSVV